MNYLDDIITVLRKNKIRLSPCSEDEVAALEVQFNISFPKAYREFLLTMGKDAGQYMRGTSCFYKDLADINEYAPELLKENNFRSLPANVFVFSMHQGYQFEFFIPGTSDDPEVYHFGEGEKLNDFSSDGCLSHYYKIMLEMHELIPPSEAH